MIIPSCNLSCDLINHLELTGGDIRIVSSPLLQQLETITGTTIDDLFLICDIESGPPAVCCLLQGQNDGRDPEWIFYDVVLDSKEAAFLGNLGLLDIELAELLS